MEAAGLPGEHPILKGQDLMMGLEQKLSGDNRVLPMLSEGQRF